MGLHWHSHNWKDEAEKYNPPSGRAFEVSGVTNDVQADIIKKELYGFTVVTQKCEGCGKTRAYKVYGKTANSSS